jgi:mono/diheme cytochrome c family protein
VPRRDFVRLIVVPALLFVGVAGTVFTLAQLHPASPSAKPVAAGEVQLGDATAGAAVFRQTCSGCHGTNAEGGIGPRLAGAELTVAEAKAQIDNGGGTMPARLVTGAREEDVLAYLETIFASSSG